MTTQQICTKCGVNPASPDLIGVDRIHDWCMPCQIGRVPTAKLRRAMQPPNEKCACGSGFKFKKCHGREA